MIPEKVFYWAAVLAGAAATINAAVITYLIPVFGIFVIPFTLLSWLGIYINLKGDNQ